MAAQRFRNTTRWSEVPVDVDDLLAVLVPKNPHVAAQIPNLVGHVHSTKTTALRRLIPNGLEEVFTTQQWWDAHVWVYRSLGVDDKFLRTVLKDEFAFFVKHSGRSDKVVYHLSQSEKHFLAGRWPDVTKARKALRALKE